MKGGFSSAIGNWSTLGIGKVWPLGSSLNGRKVFYRRTLFNFTTSRIQNMGSVTGWLDSCHMLDNAYYFKALLGRVNFQFHSCSILFSEL